MVASRVKNSWMKTNCAVNLCISSERVITKMFSCSLTTYRKDGMESMKTRELVTSFSGNSK